MSQSFYQNLNYNERDELDSGYRPIATHTYKIPKLIFDNLLWNPTQALRWVKYPGNTIMHFMFYLPIIIQCTHTYTIPSLFNPPPSLFAIKFQSPNFRFYILISFLVFNATFNSISAKCISWRPVLVVEEAGIPGENHRSWASNW